MCSPEIDTRWLMPVRLNTCRSYLMPPHRALAPKTSSTLPMIEPDTGEFANRMIGVSLPAAMLTLVERRPSP